MPRTNRDGIEIEYDTMGEADGPALLLISGLGSQLVGWDEDFCGGFVDRGFFVIRLDNRDVGLSTKIETEGDPMEKLMGGFTGGTIDAPYLLRDMAADAMAVLDDLDREHAHVMGASMGGMIAQTVAIDHGDRVLSLTSIMSTTGDVSVGGPDAAVLPHLLRPTATDRDEAIEGAVATSRAIGSPELFDEERARKRAELQYDRCYFPRGVLQQMMAIMASGSRVEALRQIDINTLVVHGDADPLVNMSGGEHTAEVITGAELLILPGVGHDLPSVVWPQVIEAVTALAGRSAS